MIRGYLRLAQACLITTFILTQRTGACQRIAFGETPRKSRERGCIQLAWLKSPLGPLPDQPVERPDGMRISSDRPARPFLGIPGVDVAVQPVAEIQEPVVYRDEDHADQARHRDRPLRMAHVLDIDDLFPDPLAVALAPMNDVGREGGADETVARIRVVMETDFERHQELMAGNAVARSIYEMVETEYRVAGVDLVVERALAHGHDERIELDRRAGALRGRKVTVLGFARSGIALARFFVDAGASVTVYDGRPARFELSRRIVLAISRRVWDAIVT